MASVGVKTYTPGVRWMNLHRTSGVCVNATEQVNGDGKISFDSYEELRENISA